MKKTIAAALSTMALCSGVALAAPTTKPVAYVTNCTTAGDALGGLQVVASGNTLTMVESSMEGTTYRYRANAAFNPALLGGGYGFSAVFQDRNANAFGGAIMNAALLTLSARDKAGQRSGFLARKGTVYYLICK